MRCALFVAFLVACSTTKPAPAPAPSPSPSPSPSATASAGATPEAIAVASAVVDAAPPAKKEPEPSFEEVLKILDVAAPEGCHEVPCALDERFKEDPKAALLARELWDKWKTVAGVEEAHTMDGGYRGMIRLEPAVPVNADRKHIEWITSAMRDMDSVFSELAASYRYKRLTLRFVRSMNGKRTPSAYAHDWTVAWNVNGSLHRTEDAVRETLVHEIFHLNDRAHAKSGHDWWSAPILTKDFEAIVRKCGTTIACLTPYTPNGTIVVGGTYYSFQPGNGVVEYAAELALRYYREQRAMLKKLPREKPFKCGPPENARSWEAMKTEFFGGIDLVPAC